ncbi:MAG: HAMP domain-containing histidine kinase [Chitinophagaceae bacterium]|nr:HAMP domain-containing histidine kinase [Chitinophagaceae bacterium]
MGFKLYTLGFIKRILYYGTEHTSDVDEQEKIKVVNFIIAPSLPILLSLIILNTVHARYLLAGTNMIVFVVGVLTILINPFRKYDTLKLVLNMILSITCTVQAICYHNGSEYFNIQNLVVVMIFFNEREFLIPSITTSVIGFVFGKYWVYTHPAIVQQMSAGRVAFNMTWFLGMMVFGLLYFKRNQRRIKMSLKEKNQQLSAANNTKEKIFTIVAHDLRSPIAQLKGGLDLVNKQYVSPEEFKNMSGVFYKQIDELQANLDTLLNWSQSQLGGITTKPVICSIKVLAEEAVSLIQQMANEKEINIACQLAPLMIYADPDQIRLVIRNLISNAVKFSKRRKNIYLLSSLENGLAYITIQDEGVGIEENTLAKLFTNEPIISSRGTEKEKGTGLGLKLCKEFIHINKGTIDVQSEIGKGTRFSISLPLAQ